MNLYRNCQHPNLLNDETMIAKVSPEIRVFRREDESEVIEYRRQGIAGLLMDAAEQGRGRQI